MQELEVNVDRIAQEEWHSQQRAFLQRLVDAWTRRGLLNESEAVSFADDLFDLDASFSTLRRTLREVILTAAEKEDDDLLLTGLTAYNTWLSEVNNHIGPTMQFLDKFMDVVGEKVGEEPD